MKALEHDALTQAKLQGYLVNQRDYHYVVYESWYCHCERVGIPMLAVNLQQHAVLLDTDSVATFLGTHENPLIATPALMPTEKLRRDVERIVSRYISKKREGRATILRSYIGLYGVWPGCEEKVARKLLDVWEEAKFFSEQATLWEVS